MVLFDLDGTLADTFPDLEWALCAALAEHGFTPGDSAAVRARVSSGARAMTEAALSGRDANSGAVREAIRLRFLDIYRDHLTVRTTLYQGMEEVLDTLDRHAIGAGVVTNKLSAYSEPLVEGLALRSRLRCVVSGDTAARAKPHPDPLLHAAGLAGVAPRDCVYVGDARNDVDAARAAGMPVAVATYGYLSPDDDPARWQADRLMAGPLELLHWLGIAD